MDVYERLLKEERSIFLRATIDENVANHLIAQMILLEQEKPGEEIKFYINSTGGQIDPGLAIYDTIQRLKSPVSTRCIEKAHSMAAILLASGERGRRFALPNSVIMIHKPRTPQTINSESEVSPALYTINFHRNRLEGILAIHTGTPQDKIHQDCERNLYMTAEMAINYGIIDGIVEDF